MKWVADDVGSYFSQNIDFPALLLTLKTSFDINKKHDKSASLKALILLKHKQDFCNEYDEQNLSL